jgi:hypothetical protein
MAKETNLSSWLSAALLGLASMWLPVFLEFGATPGYSLIMGHVGLLLSGAAVGYFKPDRPWRWGLGSILLLPFVEFIGIAIELSRSGSLSLVDPLLYTIVKVPVYTLQALPALVGAYLAAFARSGVPTWDWVSRNTRLWGLAFLLGSIAGASSLLLAQFLSNKTDPFDLWLSYIVWGGGLFFSATLIGLLEPYRTWRWAIAVSLGLPIAVLFQIIVDIFQARASHNLWPLEIFVSLLIAVPTSFTGAYFAVLTKWIFKKLRNRL